MAKSKIWFILEGMNEWPQKITKEMYNSLLDYENPIQNTVSSKGYFNYYCYNQYLWLYVVQTTGHNKRQERQKAPAQFHITCYI